MNSKRQKDASLNIYKIKALLVTKLLTTNDRLEKIEGKCARMHVENPQRFGVAKLDEKGNLMGLVEKLKQPPSSYALTGIYFLKPTIFNIIRKIKPSWKGELEITEAHSIKLICSWS